MNAQTLGLWAGALLSLAFSYVPQLKEWYEQRTPTEKRLVMLGCLLGVAVGSLALTCARISIPGVSLQCTETGIGDLLNVFVVALVSNQATYLISPKRKEPERRVMEKRVGIAGRTRQRK